MMITGVLLAIIAGILLGLYALPEKFTKDFAFENTWGLFFFLNTLIVPIIAAFVMINEPLAIFSSLPTDILMKMVIASFMWGVGVTLWGKAINYIGLSLGFSIFIGTVILIGSLLPFLVDGLPPTTVFATILGGLLIVLLGVIANGKAGLKRSAEESKTLNGEAASMVKGISIAVIGGVMATGFSYANAVGRQVIDTASLANGNDAWITALAVMTVIYISGGIPIAFYFISQLSSKKLWGNFNSPSFGKNFILISIMAVFNFSASILFAFAASKLGDAGNTVGYAIFNTVCVFVAILSGIITNEWKNASGGAKTYLYLGLFCMLLGVIVIAIGNGLTS